MTTLSPPTTAMGNETRPRAHTAMSHNSVRSHRSSFSANKSELSESHKDKKRLHTKADPSKALNEATPVEQAQEETTAEDIRAMAHKDSEGNVIAEPDRSNPTRYRFERPLDTIRAFHAAAEGTSFRRSSFNNRPYSSAGMTTDNRRASYISNSGYSPQRPRPSPGGGYYRNSSYGHPQNTVEETPGSSQMYGRNMRQPSSPHYGPPNGPPNGYHNGMQNGHPNGESPISAHSYQQSYDAATSGSDEYGKSTNPSSQNSSFDQLHQLRKQPDEFSHENPYANESRMGQHGPMKPYPQYNAHEGAYAQEAPAAPVHKYVPNNPRQPIKLDSSPDEENTWNAATSPTSPSEKKKSWIKRRFSRREN
ncbi:hypothetical protein EDD37DRAFT_235782 [Exophiala viscosa]|uniref:uncharacterized protein n=1 Tax=Exophiala viscosa TaxID=2486360 RepID=UPI002190C073|nr:hypothetical protein EDD37DRAFT_235782 [Exophiala viscosa]